MLLLLAGNQLAFEQRRRLLVDPEFKKDALKCGEETKKAKGIVEIRQAAALGGARRGMKRIGG